MGPIARWFAKHRAERELKKLEKLFAPDAVIILISSNNTELSLPEYIAAEAALFASFPDLKLEYTEADITDDHGDGEFIIDAVLTGTFTGADYVYGDGMEAVVATGAALSKETIYTLTVVDGKITKLLIAGGDPQWFYEQVAVEEDDE